MFVWTAAQQILYAVLFLATVLCMNRINSEYPILITKYPNEGRTPLKFFYIYTVDALAPKVYLVLIDLAEVLFSSAMLIAYFV